MATSLEIRETLVDALKLDLIGPSPGHALEAEVLEQHPSRWYLTGFLVPTGASLEQHSEEAGTEQPDLFDSGGGTDDAETADPPAARRVYLPSSISGFDAWLADHPGSKTKFPGLAYVMLHTLAHLLVTAVSLECGYASTSIRERVYSTQSGYGILLYTGTSDAEGTLGGLVHVARRIEQHLRMALGLGGLCANDPVCAQHRPDAAQEQRYLSGAACHGCLYIGETSCERMNDFLDRSLVVPTVEGLAAEFFGEDLL